jgi:hypothetical protein
MSKVQIKAADQDKKKGAAEKGFCPGCGGFMEHACSCPFNSRGCQVIENQLLQRYYQANGGRWHPDHKVRLQVPTPGNRVSIGNSTGHLKVRPVSSLRCIRDNEYNERSPLMCMVMDNEDALMGWDPIFEQITLN